MKIITDEKAYVQRTDISILLKMSDDLQIYLPEEVVNEVFGDVFICSMNNRHEFMEFTNKRTISFFKQQEYILDYDEVKDLSIEELNKLYLATDREISEMLEEYENLSEKEQTKKHNYYASQINLKNYKMSGINEFTLYKKGVLKINMPKDIEKIVVDEPKPKKYTRTIFNKEKWTHRKNR